MARLRAKSGLSSQRCGKGRLGSEAVWKDLVGVGFDMCGKEGEVPVGLGAEGVRRIETCYFCILLTQNQVTKSAERIILVPHSPRANRCQECDGEERFIT